MSLTAAMDPPGLGHDSLLPAVLLVEAAVGYLTGAQRTKPIATWRDTALEWAATEVRGAAWAMQPISPPVSTGAAGLTRSPTTSTSTAAVPAGTSSGRATGRRKQDMPYRGTYRMVRARTMHTLGTFTLGGGDGMVDGGAVVGRGHREARAL